MVKKVKKTRTKGKNKISKLGNVGIIKNKVVFVGVGLLVIAIGIILIIRFSTPEDSWLCTKSGWVKHGNPKADKPSIECIIPVNDL
jgi:hypothetical protein